MKCPECNESFRAALGVKNTCPFCGSLVSAPCSRCVELEQELVSIKAILADPVAVHVNVLRGTIAKLSDTGVKHVYPHLFENRGGDHPPR